MSSLLLLLWSDCIYICSYGSRRAGVLILLSSVMVSLTGAQDSHLQRVTILEAAHIQLRRGPPDDEQA
jgi:hypothetical protein